MTNRELIDYCNSGEEPCIYCPYDGEECDQFIKEMGCSPWAYRKNDDEFLKREVGETDNAQTHKRRRHN